MTHVSWGRRARAAAIALFAILFAVLVVLPSPVDAQTVTLNSTGGTSTPGDGLRIDVGDTSQLQIQRDGSGQLFEPGTLPTDATIYNGVYLALDGSVYGPQIDVYMNGTDPTPTSNVVSGTGTVADPYVSVTTFTADTATVEMRITYSVPDPFFDVKLTVDPTGSNTADLKLYHLLDTFLAGQDEGPAYIVPSVANPEVVGVRRTSPDNLVAFSKTADAFDAVYSGLYSEMWKLIDGGGDLDGTNDTDPMVDNGIGVQWNLGVITAPVSVEYRITFSDQLCTPGSGSKTSPDSGCDAALPACHPTLSTCVDCLNDGYCEAGEVCDVGQNTCVTCIDDQAGAGQDTGCTATFPLCLGVSGNFVCEACVDDQLGSAVDLGCSASLPICDISGPAPFCICDGCSAPTCIASGGTMSNPDLGCSSTFPACNPAQDACVECRNNGYCSAGETCDTTSSTCVPGATDGGITDGGITDGGITDGGGNFRGGALDCGCRVQSRKGSSSAPALLLLGLALILYRRRRR